MEGNGAATGLEGGGASPGPTRAIIQSFNSATETRKRVYAIEENLYGLLVMPNTMGHPSVYCLLGLFYLIAAGLLTIITLGVSEQMESVQSEIHDLCTQDGANWDCRPPGYSTLLDFDALDANGDGYWSVPEARQAGLLSIFKTLLDVVLETPELLKVAAPPTVPQLSIYCHTVMNFGVVLPFLDPYELLSMTLLAVSMAETSLDTYQQLPDCVIPASEDPNVWDHEAFAQCVSSTICGDLEGAERRLHLTDGKTSRARYLNVTQFLSVMDRSLHEVITSNLIRPCRLVEPQLCANAEVPEVGFLAGVPVWAALTPEARVKQCKHYVEETCPRLFGAQYSGLHVRMSGVCGERSFKPTTVPRSPPVQSLIPAEGAQCTDDDAGVQQAVLGIELANPLMEYVFKGAERLMGGCGGPTHCQDAAQIRSGLTCALADQINLCNLQMGLVDPSDNVTFTTVGTIIGKHCPQACCTVQQYGEQYGCPAQCGASDLWVAGVAGEFTCMGYTCQFLETTEYNASGNFLVRRSGYEAAEAARILIRTDWKVRLQILTMTLNSSLVGKQDTQCLEDFLRVDGVSYCADRRPEFLEIPRRIGGVIEIEWSSRNACPACEWSIIISDAGEPQSYTVSSLEFKLQSSYHHSVRGFMTWQYTCFFVLILMAWFAFMSLEFEHMVLYFEFIAWCPSFPGDKKLRMGILLGVWVPRLALFTIVAVEGILLLIVAESFLDIVLNGVALAFIVDIDDYLYQAAVPQAVKDQVKQAEPLEWEVQRVGYPFSQMLLRMGVLVSLGVAITAYQYMRGTGYRNTSTAVDCLCGISGDMCIDNIFSDY